MYAMPSNIKKKLGHYFTYKSHLDMMKVLKLLLWFENLPVTQKALIVGQNGWIPSKHNPACQDGVKGKRSAKAPGPLPFTFFLFSKLKKLLTQFVLSSMCHRLLPSVALSRNFSQTSRG